MVFHTDLPKDFTLVSTGHHKLKSVLMRAMNLWVELDQEPFSLEAQFANLGPIEGIYFCVSLKNLKAHMRNS